MILFDASNNSENVGKSITSGRTTPNCEVGDYVKKADESNIFSKVYTSNWNREINRVNQVLQTQPPLYKLEKNIGEII